MKKKSINAFLSFVLCFLFTFTSSCSNLSAIFSNNTTTPVISNNVSSSSLDNDFKKLLNSEYKRFSIKAGEPAGTSITLSKRYVLSTKTVQTYLPTDYDSAGQPPNRIKITAVVKIADVTSGLNFVIDGVTTFNVPAGVGSFPNGVTATNIDATYRQYDFIWDGRYTTGNLVEDGIYAVHALKTFGTKTLYLDTEIQVTSDPLVGASSEYYNPQQFKDLSNLVEQIKAPEDTANALYDVVNELNILQNKLTSLQIRVPVDSIKVADVQKQIADFTAKKLSLESSLTSSINNLSTQKDSLRSFINTITKNSNFTQDYPIVNKPESVTSYLDTSLYYDIDISSLVQANVKLYQPDPNDPNQTDTKNSWEINQTRIDALNPSSVFSASDYISNEIQTTKELLNDYTNNVFLPQELPEATQTLKRLITQINNHKGYLKTRINKLYKDYDKLFQDSKNTAINLHNSLLLPFAVAMDNEGSFKDNTFVTAALKFDTKNIFDSKALQDWIITYTGVFQSYQSAPYTKREKIAHIVAGYTKSELDEIKDNDLKYGTKTAQDLVTSADNLVGSFLSFIPTTETEVMIYLGTIILAPEITVGVASVAGFAFLSKLAINRFVSKLALSTTLKYTLIAIQDTSNTIRARLSKIMERILPSVAKNIPCFGTNGFYTKSVALVDCPKFIEFLKEAIINNGNTGNRKLQSFYDSLVLPRIYTKSEIIKSELSKAGAKKVDLALSKAEYIALDINNPKRKILDQLKSKTDIFRSNAINGIPIRKLKTKDIYAPDFRGFAVSPELKMSTNTWVGGRKKVIGGSDDFITACETWMSQDPNLATAFNNSPNQLKEFLREVGLTWHHVEDLDTMILVPRELHAGLDHFGASSLIKKLDSVGGVNFRQNWDALILLGYQ